MGLSLCLLMKNESQQIRECLEDIVDLFEEIIIVDNGSTDSSLHIASEFADQIFVNVEGEQDELRNFYLERASQSWILSLDFDERISRNTIIRIKNLINHVDEKTVAIRLPRNEYIGNGKWVTTEIIRVLRNHPDLRYDNSKIHSSPLLAIRKMEGSILKLNVEPIHHLDILIKNRTEEKRKVYLEKLHSEISNGNKTPYLIAFLGQEYASIGSYDMAFYYYNKATEIDPKNPFSSLYLSQLWFYLNNLDKAFTAINRHLTNTSYFRDSAYNLLAQISYENGDNEMAIQYFNHSLELQPQNSHDYLNLWALTPETNDIERLSYLKKALKYNPYLTSPRIYIQGSEPNVFKLQNPFLKDIQLSPYNFISLNHTVKD